MCTSVYMGVNVYLCVRFICEGERVLLCVCVHCVCMCGECVHEPVRMGVGGMECPAVD